AALPRPPYSPVHRNGARQVQGLLEGLTLGLGHLGAAASGRRQARDEFRFPLNHLGIRACIPLGNRFLDKLDSAIQLLIRHVLDRIAVLDVVLAGDKQSEDLEIGRRLRPAHLRNGLSPVLGETPQQRANHRLAHYSATPARWGWRASCRSAGTRPIAAAVRPTGSR